jgi:hypothetical protein
MNLDRKFYCAYDLFLKMTRITIFISANQEEGPKIFQNEFCRKKILPSSLDFPPKLLEQGNASTASTLMQLQIPCNNLNFTPTNPFINFTNSDNFTDYKFTLFEEVSYY